MKKRVTAVLLAATMAVSIFAACGKKEAAVEVKEEPVAEEPAAEQPAEEPAAEEPVQERGEVPQPIVMSKYDYVQSRGDERTVYNYTNSYLDLSPESREKFPELAKTLDEIAAESKETMESELKTNGEAAQNEYSDGYMGADDPAYETEIKTSVTRCDDKVLSSLKMFYSFTGGAHGFYYSDATNFDVKTGEVITPAMAFKDLSVLPKLIKDKLIAENPDLAEEFESFGIDDTLALYEKDEEYHFDFSLDPCGVAFYFAPYDLASYAAGAQVAYFSYGELADVLDEKYVAEKDMPGVFTVSNYDIDSDGDIEVIETMLDYKGEDAYYYGVKVSVDGQEYDIDADVLGADIRQQVVRTSGGKVFLLVTGSVENDYSVTYVCDISDKTVKKTDEVWYRTWTTVSDEEVPTYGSYVLVDPDALPLAEHMDIMSTFYGEKTYKLGDDGKFTSEDPFFIAGESYRRMTLHTVKDVTVDIVDEDGNVTESKVTLPAGSDIHIYRTDGVTDEDKKATVDCTWEGHDGYVRFIRTNDYPHMVNGIDEYELFETLYYAG